MYIIHRDFWDVSRADEFYITPLGDVHDGHQSCDLTTLRKEVVKIAADDRHYTILMGDLAEYVKMSDRRFDEGTLAPWISRDMIGNLVNEQTDHVIAELEPVAGSTLCILEGNHEALIRRKYEQDVYLQVVKHFKGLRGMKDSERLGLHYTGWLVLRFYRAPYPKRKGATTIRIWLHHGFVGGALAGAKALNMQRVLWSRECELALMGHSHNADTYRQAQEMVRGGKVVKHLRKGAFTGAFLGEHVEGRPAYYEEKGMFPLFTGTITVKLRPGAEDVRERVKLIS
jgi:hypothetical protein